MSTISAEEQQLALTEEDFSWNKEKDEQDWLKIGQSV